MMTHIEMLKTFTANIFVIKLSKEKLMQTKTDYTDYKRYVGPKNNTCIESCNITAPLNCGDVLLQTIIAALLFLPNKCDSLKHYLEVLDNGLCE